MSLSRVIEVSFNGGSIAYVKADTAYFYNNGIIFKPTDIDLPASYQVHWADSPQASSTLETIGTAEGAPIPDDLWDRSRVIYGWIYLHPTEDSGVTAYEVRIYKNVRAGLPDGTEPTPAEQSTIDQLISALNTAVEQTGEDVESASQSAQSAESAKTAAESARDTAGEYANDAESSAASASTSASQASASATASANSASASAQIKADVEDLVDDAQGYARASAQSASASANSATTAQGYANSASASAQSASGYASSAQTSAQTASAKASEASTSASTASTKASESAQSASQALSYKTDAESAKTASQTAQGLAESARDSAITAKNEASQIKTDVQNIADGIDTRLVDVEDALIDKAPIITDTASGSIASFSDGADNIPMKSLVVDIDPVQDLHGYDNPWPAGGGINKANYPSMITAGATEQTDGSLYVATANTLFNHVIFQNDGTTGQFSVTFTYKNEGTSRGLYPVVKYTDNTEESLSVNSGSTTYVTVTKTSSNSKTVDSVYFKYGSNVKTWFYVQVESGSTAHGWTPYENICPISGWTQGGVEQRGKNLCSNRFSDYTQPYDYRVFPIRLEKGQQYTFSVKLIGQALTGCTLGITRSGDRYQNFDRPSPWQFVKSDGTIANATVTYIIDDRWTSPKIILYVSDEATFNSFFENYEVQLEAGSTATPYSSYTGRSITIDLGQTVYGGKLDVLSGELVVYPYYASYNGETLTGEWISDRDKYVSGTTPTIGAQVVNIGAQGLTVQLEPHEVESLYGVNNLWADSGNTEVEYRADTKLFIERLTAPDSADMIADSNITSGQYFMVGNSLYKATANIANGSAIIVGTNCIRKSLSEALNEINA